jgi:replicative DNA helicase
MCLAAASACIAGKVEVKGRGGHAEPANIYAVTVLGVANRKTAVVNLVAGPLLRWQERQAKEARPRIAEAKDKLARLLGDQERIRREFVKADAHDRGNLEEQLTRLARDVDSFEVPTPPRLLADDVTPEKLAHLLAENGGRLAILSDEGTAFHIMAGRYSADGAPNLDVYLKAHSGTTIQVDRKNSPPVFVGRPALTMGLTIQPGVMAGLSAKPQFRGQGLLARFLYAVPFSMVGRRNVTPATIDPKLALEYDAMLVRLLELPFAEDEFHHDATHPLLFDRKATAKLESYMGVLEPQLGPEGDLYPIADWAGKLIGAVMRIAGVLHMVKYADHPSPWDLKITVDTLTAAWGIAMPFLVKHAQAVFGEMGADPDMEGARFILELIHKNGWRAGFTRRQLGQDRVLKHRYRSKELDRPLALLVELEWLRKDNPPPPPDGKRVRGGQVKESYTVNPALWAQP